MSSDSSLPSAADVLDAVSAAFGEYVSEEDPRVVSELLLDRVLRLTQSEYGFIGRVERAEDGRPQLRTTAITNIAWNEETRAMVARAGPNGMVFRNLDTLFGRVLVTERPVISNDPAVDPRSGGLPPGHPPLRAFLGVPLFYQRTMLGMVGVANRAGGYGQELRAALDPFFLACGNILQAWVAAEHQRRTAAALRHSEARHRLVLEAATEAVVTIDASGTILGVNPATERLFGYAPAELVGSPVTTLMPEPYRSQHDTFLARFVSTGSARPIGGPRQLPACRRDGAVFPVELSLSEASVDGQRLFTGILRDVSARAAAEREAAHYLLEVERARGHLDQILDEMSVGCVLLDAEGRAEFASKACAWLLSVGAGDERPSWRTWLPLGSADALTFEAMLQSPDGDARLDTVAVRGRDGATRHLRVQVRVDPRDRTRRLVYLHDVTELVRQHEAPAGAETWGILGQSEAVHALRSAIRQVAPGDWNVLIEGETGTGKDLVARAIHDLSPRADRPFVALNCALLNAGLVASTLFGHRRGAFTGADRDHVGVIEAADGGTLLLDEIGDLGPDVQAALLRVVQDKEFRRVGDTRTRKVDVRILFATHRSLADEVTAGRFRADLFFRIRVARVIVPPLRARAGDVRLLAGAFVRRHGRGRYLGPGVVEALDAYPWPGNVRELLAAIDYACIQCPEGAVERHHLPPEVVARAPLAAAEARRPRSLGREEILAALEAAGGARAEAARRLGIGRASLYRRLHELGLHEEDRPSRP